MPPRRNKNWPKDILELFDIFYGGDYKRRKEYLDSLQNILSQQNEKIARKSINSDLVVEKISECRNRSPDFKIESEKVIIEVTTLQSGQIDGRFSMDEKQLISKINEAFFHVDFKREGYDDYSLIGYIFINNIINIFTNLGMPEIFIPLLKKSIFKELRIDALYIRVVDAQIHIAGSNGSIAQEAPSTSLFPPFIIIKDINMKTEMKKIFPNTEKIFLLNNANSSGI